MISADVEKVDGSIPGAAGSLLARSTNAAVSAPYSAPNGKRAIVAAVGEAAATKIIAVLGQHTWVSFVDIASILGVSTKTVTWFWRGCGGGRRPKGYCNYYPVGLLRLPNGLPDLSKAALAMRMKLVRELLAPELPVNWRPSPRRPRVTGAHGWRSRTDY